MLAAPGHKLRTECPPHVDVDWHTPATPLYAQQPYDDDDDDEGEEEDDAPVRRAMLRGHRSRTWRQ